MKNLIILGILVFAACLGSSCQDVTIGFLQTEDAGYNPDTMVVKKELDTTPPQLQEVDNPLTMNCWKKTLNFIPRNYWPF